LIERKLEIFRKTDSESEPLAAHFASPFPLPPGINRGRRLYGEDEPLTYQNNEDENGKPGESILRKRIIQYELMSSLVFSVTFFQS
jgi:hypothetical protein